MLAPRKRARVIAAQAVLALLVMLVPLGMPAAHAAGGVDEVHYTFTSQTSVAIDWRGDATDLRWGPTAAYGNTATGSAPQWTPWSSPGPFRQVQLTGLAPGAEYHYSIGGGPDYTFHTPPTGDFRFDAIGDVGDTVSFGKLGDTFDRIASDNPSFVIMDGDLTYANATGSSPAVIDQHFNDVMRWSTFAAYMPAWGNHEYDVPGADDLRNYKGRLLMPNAEASPGSPSISCCGNDWGWFDAGPVRFIIYPEPWTGALSDWQSKAAVLMRQAQADPSIKYIVTFGHRPAYSTGYHPGEQALASILDGFGDTYNKYVLNINGHSHDYERFQPIHGVTHVTVGAPASLELPWTSTDPRTAYRAMHLSHLRVDVSSTGMRLQAICDDASSKDDMTCEPGSVIDQYEIGAPAPSPAPTNLYVDKTVPGCSDAGQGTQAVPFCTITKGVSRLLPGSTLYVGNGTYAETIKPTSSGQPGQPLTVSAWPGRHPVVGSTMAYGAYLSGRSYVTVSNLTFNGTVGEAIYVTKGSFITVSGNTVTSAGSPAKGDTAPGIAIKNTTDSTVTGNTVTGASDAGIYVTNSSTRVTVSYNIAARNAAGFQRSATGIWVNAPGNTVIGNVLHDNEDSGLQFTSGGNNNLAALNVSYNNGDHGIDDLNVTGGRLIGNTVYRNCTSGINVEGTSGNYTVQNNVAVDNAVYPAYQGISCTRRAGNIGIWDSAPATTTVDHNLVWLSKPGTMYTFGSSYPSLAAMQSATHQESHGVEADPRFLDPAAGDFQLTAGSPAIDRADSGASGEQSADLLGFPRVDDPLTPNTGAEGPRAYDDLGAFEFQPDAGGPAPAPVAALQLTPTRGAAPLLVSADASASTDPSGQSLSYSFDFGDGSTVGPQSQATATHTYAQAGSYPVTVTVTDASGLSDSIQRTVTVADTPPPPLLPPTAALALNPAGGDAPLPVTADASASTDPQGQPLSYVFSFGDGAVVGPQAGATAQHTYVTPGTYTVKVTVTNASGLTSSTQSPVTVTGAAPVVPKYVNQVAVNSSTSSKTSASITVWRPGGVAAGDLVVLTLRLSGTAATGPVSATDDAGNSYTMATSVADSSGNRLVVLSGVAVQNVPVNGKITATFPQATGGYWMGGDEFSGATSVDRLASASGPGATFSSGPSGTTSSAREAVFGAVAVTSAAAKPVWDTGWKDAGSYAVGSGYVGRGYQVSSGTGSFSATGTAGGPWLAALVTFSVGAPPPPPG